MNILITGSSGFLGRYIVENLLNFNVKTLSRSNCDYNVSLDCQVPTFNEYFEIIIHAAGKAHFSPNNIIESQDFFNVNLIGTQNLLLGLENCKIPKRFVFISSVAVYGLEAGKDINEKYPLSAKDPYGLSKIKAEQLVIDWCNINNVICTILRLPLLVGENPPGNLGAMIKGVQKGFYFNIAGGKARKSMVLAEDVAKILIKASEIGGVFNLTDGVNPNFNELSNSLKIHFGKSRIFNLPFCLAKIIALVGDFVGNKFPINSKRLDKITSNLTFDDAKARKILGWNPKKVLDYYSK
jgi:nucleoside-diphosphate-sugar epimerase